MQAQKRKALLNLRRANRFQATKRETEIRLSFDLSAVIQYQQAGAGNQELVITSIVIP
jgi:hypothetical protein